jgi:hypothetical protein
MLAAIPDRVKRNRIDEHEKHRHYLNAHVCSGHGRVCAANRYPAEHPATASAGVASNHARRADHSHHWQDDNVGKHNNPDPDDNDGKPNKLDSADNAVPADDAVPAHNCIRSRISNAGNNRQRYGRVGASHRLVLDP